MTKTILLPYDTWFASKTRMPFVARAGRRHKSRDYQWCERIPLFSDGNFQPHKSLTMLFEAELLEPEMLIWITYGGDTILTITLENIKTADLLSLFAEPIVEMAVNALANYERHDTTDQYMTIDIDDRRQLTNYACGINAYKTENVNRTRVSGNINEHPTIMYDLEQYRRDTNEIL